MLGTLPSNSIVSWAPSSGLGRSSALAGRSTRRHQGYITIGNGAIRPGAGAGKTLPEVGDIFITGIVNVSGSFEQLLLQTTRLATIFHMAESISQGILLACRELEAAGTSELLL